MRSPLRRLQGVSYWVIDDPEGVRGFVNTELRKEWEEDAKFEGRDPKEDPWLKTVSHRKWKLQTVSLSRVKLNLDTVGYVNQTRNYRFSESLAKRAQELKACLERYATVLWPLVIRGEDMQLADGYCRYATLKKMRVSKTFAYIGTLHVPKASNT